MEGRREDRAQVMLEEDFEAHHNRDPYFRTIEFHAHDFLELYLFLDGSVTYYIEDQVYDLCPGDLLIIPPGRMHRPVIANERAAYERMVLWVELDYIARIDSAAGELQAALPSGRSVLAWNAALFALWHIGYVVPNLAAEDLAAVAGKVAAGLAYGVLLAAMRRRTGNVWGAFLAHGVCNLFRI